MEKIKISTKSLLIIYFKFITGFNNVDLEHKFKDTCALRNALLFHTFVTLISLPVLLYSEILKLIPKLKRQWDPEIVRALKYVFMLFLLLGGILFASSEKDPAVLKFTIENIFIVFMFITPLFMVIFGVLIFIIFTVVTVIEHYKEKRRESRPVRVKSPNVFVILYKSYRERWCKPITFE